jgi:hypothetical protein
VSFTATVHKKLVKWCEDEGIIMPSNFVLTTSSTKPDMTWLEKITFVDWQTVKAIKLPKNVRSTTNGRIPGSYDIFESGDLNEDVPADDIDTSNPIFWMIGRWYDGRATANWLSKHYPGSTLVMMRDGRQAKFQRNFPKAREAREVIWDAWKAWKAAILKDDALAIKMRQDCDNRVAVLDPDLVDDPEIKAARKVMDRDTSKLDDQIAAWSNMGYYYNPEEDSDVPSPLDKYPLLPEQYYFNRYMKRHADHVHRYLNSEYAFLKAQGKVK